MEVLKTTEHKALPTSLAALSSRLNDLHKVDLIFSFRELFNRYIKNPEMFELCYEASRLYKFIDEGMMPSNSFGEGAKKHDWHILNSMSKNGFWLAEPKCREMIVRFSYDKGGVKKRTDEVFQHLQMSTGRQPVEREGADSVAISTALRLAGFVNSSRRRDGKSVRVWSVKDREDTVEDCIARMNNTLEENIKLWE